MKADNPEKSSSWRWNENHCNLSQAKPKEEVLDDDDQEMGIISPSGSPRGLKTQLRVNYELVGLCCWIKRQKRHRHSNWSRHEPLYSYISEDENGLLGEHRFGLKCICGIQFWLGWRLGKDESWEGMKVKRSFVERQTSQEVQNSEIGIIAYPQKCL